MPDNPYIYEGPLDPIKHSLVCIPRSGDVNRVIEGINRGDYWVILGPKQIGKTTFLRRIQQSFPNAYHLYFDFEIPPSNSMDFYQWLAGEFLNEIPFKGRKPSVKEWKSSPELRFFDFLDKFKPKEDKHVILFFDEIDGLPFIYSFLHGWRKVYHDRYKNKDLNRYIVITSGSKDLIALTIGPNSPFNIAKKLFIKDFSADESKELIEKPFKKLGINIDEKAKEKLVSQLSGHPQMLQEACCKLVEAAQTLNKPIAEEDVNKTLEGLLVTNSSLEALKHDINNNHKLEELMRCILDGDKKKYYPYKEFSLLGSGPIVEHRSHCAIRNKIYEEFLSNILEIPPDPPKNPIGFVSSEHTEG